MSSLQKELKLELQGETEVVFTRHFAAPRELVYDCHTKPELMRRWLTGPDGWEYDICEVDLRVGGKYLSSWQFGAGGTEVAAATEGGAATSGQNKFGFHGSYREIAAPGRIVNTESFIPDMAAFDRNAPEDMATASVNTLLLTSEGNATLMTLVCKYPSAAIRTAALDTGMADGMEASYKRLDRMLVDVNR